MHTQPALREAFMTQTVFVICDDPAELERLQTIVCDRLGYQTITATGGREAIDYFMLRRTPRPHLVLVSLMMPDVCGTEVTRAIRRVDPHLPVVVMAPPRRQDMIAAAVKAGASDILLQPASYYTLRLSLQNLLKHSLLREELDRMTRQYKGYISFDDLIGRNAAFLDVLLHARQVAPTRSPVLIQGERGTGKELVARAVHGTARPGEPFVSLNCAGMPPRLFSELFAQDGQLDLSGYKGLHQTQSLRKLWDQRKGTLFLKHIEYLPEAAQTALAALLEEMQSPAGSSHPLDQVRIVASGSSSLKNAMQEDHFREDLYFRLSRITLHLPPLVQRGEDIVPLAEYFISRNIVSDQNAPCQLQPDARQLLNNYLWPGNVSELARVIARATLQCDSHALRAWHIAPHLNPHAFRSREALIFEENQQQIAGQGLSLFNLDGNIKPIEQVEAEMIRTAIAHYKGKMTEVARRLGIGRSTLYRKMQDYKLSDAA
jgi:DNA-binding NtrC family response regulator